MCVCVCVLADISMPWFAIIYHYDVESTWPQYGWRVASFMAVWVMMRTRGCRCVILGGQCGRVDGLPSANRYVMFVILVVGKCCFTSTEIVRTSVRGGKGYGFTRAPLF